MAISASACDSARHQRHLLTLPARAVTPVFLPTAVVLSIANRPELRAWGWAPLDHHGVPWPSSLALLPGGRLQALSFAGSGASLITLARALPRGGQSGLLATCGAGLLAGGLPLGPPGRRPGRSGVVDPLVACRRARRRIRAGRVGRAPRDRGLWSAFGRRPDRRAGRHGDSRAHSGVVRLPERVLLLGVAPGPTGGASSTAAAVIVTAARVSLTGSHA